MHRDLTWLRNVDAPLTFVFCAGFEERVTRTPGLLLGLKIRAARILTLTYAGNRHDANNKVIQELATGLCPREEYSEVNVADFPAIYSYLGRLNAEVDTVIIDITGLSRVTMMVILTTIYDMGLRYIVAYTEAREYYPTRSYFEKLTGGDDLGEAFLKLSQFEKDEILYSTYCDVEEVPGLMGRMLPNYPLMLVTFLTFKRGRVSAILQAYEANVRILIKSVPVRDDLKWRAAAIEIPNFDLLEDGVIEELETLDWKVTHEFLTKLYNADNNKYRFNFMMAPLGSKMQTVGAWLFAKECSDVKVVTSTPKEIFHEKYSLGFGQTFLFDNLPTKSRRDV